MERLLSERTRILSELDEIEAVGGARHEDECMQLEADLAQLEYRIRLESRRRTERQARKVSIAGGYHAINCCITVSSVWRRDTLHQVQLYGR